MEYVSTLIRPIVHYMYYVMVYMYVCMDGMGVQCTVYVQYEEEYIVHRYRTCR